MAVGNALMDMYREMQEELKQKQQAEGEKTDSVKTKKVIKPKAVVAEQKRMDVEV